MPNTEPIQAASRPLASPRRTRKLTWTGIARNWKLYLFVAPAFLYFLIFSYLPMYGIQIAFKNYVPTLGFAGSPWVGFDHFKRFFHSYYFWDLIWNTTSISLYELAVGFPIPIILALAFNEVKTGSFKKLVQTVTYAPHFISVVVMAGMIITFLSPSTGIIIHILEWSGLNPPDFLTDPRWFKTMYVSPASGRGPGGGRSSTWPLCQGWIPAFMRPPLSTAPAAFRGCVTSTSGL